MLVHVSLRRITLVSALVGVLALGAAPAANAGLLVSSATGCSSDVLTQPFLPWLGPRSLRARSRRRLRGRCLRLAPRGSGDHRDQRALLRPQPRATGPRSSCSPADSATSPTMCVGIEHPTLRFFARHDGALTSTLRVDVIYTDALGNRPARSRSAGSSPAISWSPTLPMPVIANLLALLPGERTRIAFRFVAQGDAVWQIDDVYVDPYRKG